MHQVVGIESPLKGCVWMRSMPGAAGLAGLVSSASGSFSPIPGSEDSPTYKLTAADVDCYISFSCTWAQEGVLQQLQAEAAIGPVTPGPPRLLELTVGSAAVSLTVGCRVEAQATYIGGQEGASEYWWMRIRNGEREQLGDPRPVDPSLVTTPPSADSDPRCYVITKSDVGCVLKVKCRPVRRDGFKGEIFTSKPSAPIG